LPVVVGGGHKQTVEACLWRSYLFPLMQHFHLTTNMHLQSQPDFQNFLLDISEGKTGSKVEIPLGMVVHGNSLDGLIDTIFDDPIDFFERVILVSEMMMPKKSTVKSLIACQVMSINVLVLILFMRMMSMPIIIQ